MYGGKDTALVWRSGSPWKCLNRKPPTKRRIFGIRRYRGDWSGDAHKFHFERYLQGWDENIDALLEVPGIGEKTLQKISASYEEVKSTGELIMLLQKAGISPHIAMEMQKLYGEDAEEDYPEQSLSHAW